MNDIFDLSKMGYREIEKAGELLKAYANSRPDSWCDSGVKLACNAGSGFVFLTNDDFQCLILEDDKAVMFYSLSWDNHEGTIEELYSDFKNDCMDERNYEELADYLEAEHMTDEAEEVRQAIHNLMHEDDED